MDESWGKVERWGDRCGVGGSRSDRSLEETAVEEGEGKEGEEGVGGKQVLLGCGTETAEW